MQITLICCPFKTSFGSYGASLKAAIEKKTGNPVQWVASNCGCGMVMADRRLLLADQCDYFEMLHPTDFVPSWLSWIKPQSGVSNVVSTKTWKRQLRAAARTVFFHFRAKRYAKLSKSANVVHFQQVLGAYGADAVFNWLKEPSNATRIVTVHELDPDQLEAPEMNKIYNRADGIIVHCEDMRKDLIRLNVPEKKIHLVLYGTKIPASLPDNRREGIVFYGGYNLTHNKGLDPLFKAMSIIQRRMGANAPTLKIHGYYAPALREQATLLAEEHGVANKIVWLDHLSEEDAFQLYQHSQVCVLPYTGSFAGLGASIAAACQLPVVCTRKAGLPDHLGDLGVWVEENNPEQLAERIMELLGDDHMRQEIGARLLKRAQEFLSWDVIADRTLKIYEESTRKKAGGNTVQNTTKSSVRVDGT